MRIWGKINYYSSLFLTTYSKFSLFMEIMVYTIAMNSEFMNSEPLLLGEIHS